MKQITTRSMRIAAMVVVMLVPIALVAAQQPMEPAQDISSREMQQFATALTEIQQLQVDSQAETRALIEDSEIGMERFNELHQSAQHNGGVPADATDQEARQYQRMMAGIMERQDSLQATMAEIVEDAGLDVQRFNSIVMAIQNDADLWEEIQSYMN